MSSAPPSAATRSRGSGAATRPRTSSGCRARAAKPFTGAAQRAPPPTPATGPTSTTWGAAAADAGEGPDFHAVESGYVSITPLQIDLTNRDQMEDVTQWLDRAKDG